MTDAEIEAGLRMCEADPYDMRFCAYARTALPEALKEIKRLREALSAIQTAIVADAEAKAAERYRRIQGQR